MIFEDLASEVREVLDAGVDEVLTDDAFNDLALRVFRFQCQENPAYGAFVARRGCEPGRVHRWESIPCLPTRAFKAAPLVAGDPSKAERVFRTSGTTLGPERRGRHFVLDLSLYRASLLPNFEAHVLPEGSGRFVALSLLPSPTRAPDSSLSFMMGEVSEVLCKEESGFYVSDGGRIDFEGFLRALEKAGASGEPVLVAGTAFSLAGWVEQAREKGWDLSLPPGSRIMETGGFKGRSTEWKRGDLYTGLEDVMGVPETRIINEYGMTELLSQFYEPILRQPEAPPTPPEASAVALDRRFHRGPPWVRTLVRDPVTLAPLQEGEVGVLAHVDLANVGSVAAVLTEDLGRKMADGFQLLGRSAGSEPRGCSLAMEDFLSSRGGGN